MPYGTAADMWSFGVTLAMLLAHCGRRPLWPLWMASVEVADQLKSLVSERKERKASDETLQLWHDAEDLVDRLLLYRPEERLTAEQVLAHPFVQAAAVAAAAMEACAAPPPRLDPIARAPPAADVTTLAVC